MGRQRLLTDEQARIIVARAGRGVPQVRIAKQFKVSQELVSRIVRGITYGDVTGLTRTRSFAGESNWRPCCTDARCARCQSATTCEENIATVRALIGVVRCANEGCRAETTSSVAAVLSSRGRVKCKKCDRRRR